MRTFLAVAPAFPLLTVSRHTGDSLSDRTRDSGRSVEHTGAMGDGNFFFGFAAGTSSGTFCSCETNSVVSRKERRVTPVASDLLERGRKTALLSLLAGTRSVLFVSLVSFLPNREARSRRHYVLFLLCLSDLPYGHVGINVGGLFR